MRAKILFLSLFMLVFIPSIVLADNLEITGSQVRIRSLPGTSGSILKTTNHGDTFTLLSNDKFKDQGGCSAGWYKVSVDGQEGYVCSTYGRIISTAVAIDPSAVSECEKDLAAKGFPKEYWGGLCNLKVNHPNWTFNPVNTGLEFSTAVEKESACGKNTISTTNQEYIDTSCKGSFDSGYKPVSQKAVAYYLNPTNFFDEKNIFMFESNHVNPNISDELYSKTTSSIINSFMLTNLPTLTNAINQSSRECAINQVMVSSRIRQEIGSGKATSGAYAGQLLSCISGVYTTRWGTLLNGKSMDYYYNFFNVGVYDGSNGDAAYRAVKYAANNGWGGTGNQEQDVKLAITGGINFLKNGYVLAGQDTIYFQKFNTHPVSSSSLYTHQYMSNIQAPMSEATIAYNAYKSASMLNSPFVFNIPIYNNLGSSIDNTPNGPSGDNGNNTSNGMSSETILTESGYKLDGTKLMGLDVGMTLNDLNNKISALGGSISGSDLSAKVATGTVVKISNGTEVKEYTLIVKGDSSGDGVINALDLLQIQKSILGTYKMNDAQKLAADTSKDGSVNALDLLQVQKNILGTYKIEQK